MRGLIQRRDLILLGLGIVLGSVLILSSNLSLANLSPITNTSSTGIYYSYPSLGLTFDTKSYPTLNDINSVINLLFKYQNALQQCYVNH